MAKRNINNENTSVLYKRYSELLKERFAIFSLFVFIATSMNVGTYYATSKHICNDSKEKIFLLIFMFLLMIAITTTFYLLLKKTNYFIKNSRILIGKLQNETKEKYHCFSHSQCFNFLLLVALVSYTVFLLFIWYPPDECKDKKLGTGSCNAFQSTEIKSKILINTENPSSLEIQIK